MTISNLETSKMVMDLSGEVIRVLHVDDDRFFLKVAKECLEMQGPFHVDMVSSVEEALEKLKKKQYDIVISEYKMPGKDGLEFLKELRQSGDTIPFVIFTGKGGEEVAINALNLGADGYFNKSGAPESVYGELMHGLRRIVKKRKATDALGESEKNARALFNLMVDPVAIVDDRGKILEVTQKVEEITGYTREELVGKNFFRLLIASAETKPVMLRNLPKQMLGTQISPCEVEMLTKDGEKLAYEISAAKIDFKRKPADILVFRDISARKRLEEKLRVVGSLTRHDVRNKLTVIAGNSYLLRQRLAGDPRVLRHLEDIDAAVRQVERIFDFARTYEKLGTEELTYVDTKQILKEVESLFSDLKGIEIVNDCNGVTVLADSLLNQVFYNLIDNSLKYGKKIKRIRVHYDDEGNQLKLIYKDDGVGISDNMRSSLFKEGGGKGTGYGLFMVRRICEVYGWAIEETGKQGKGVQFTMTIPRKNRAGKTLYKIQE